jgi:hypothetical protein
MGENASIGTALSAETVDARFWALVCDDEQWLRSEFDGIVSGPAEPPARGAAGVRGGHRPFRARVGGGGAV